MSAFLLPLVKRPHTTALHRFGANEIFDRNVIWLTAQFMVRRLVPVVRLNVGFFFFQFTAPVHVTPLDTWTGQFREPHGLCACPDSDMVFVADTEHHRVVCFRADGTLLHEFGRRILDEEGEEVAVFSPHCLAVHSSRQLIFVTDDCLEGVHVFTFAGAFIGEWGRKYYMETTTSWPSGVAVHTVLDLVYVCNREQHTVSLFDLEGNMVRRWGTKGRRGGELSEPSGIAVHPYQDLVFVSDNEHRIQAFRSDGTFLYQWGGEGDGVGEFEGPPQLAIHMSRSLLFAADWCNERIQVFDLQGAFICECTVPNFASVFGIALLGDRVFVSDEVNHLVKVFSM